MSSFATPNRQTTSFSNPSKNVTAFTLPQRDLGLSLLLKEDGGYLEKEDGFGIILEQATQGDMWALPLRN